MSYRLYGAETGEKLLDPNIIYIEIKYGVWIQKLNTCWRIRDAETPVYTKLLLVASYDYAKAEKLYSTGFKKIEKINATATQCYEVFCDIKERCT